MPEKKEKIDLNKDATASFKCGIVANVLSLIFFVFFFQRNLDFYSMFPSRFLYEIFEFLAFISMFLGWIPGFAGIVFGIMGLYSSKKSTAIIGIILSAAGLCFYNKVYNSF
jgi:hypothetical protein